MPFTHSHHSRRVDELADAADQQTLVSIGAKSLTGVRDSKDPSGPALLFGADAWDGFLSGLKADRFDR
ncbi:DUF397 domain-containing protein [Saccharopolyspora sp. ASAGF58]|uniref:DUF397 domain-containing protein n=1 Tax=Saccharopolyspora sp. ASAGF58 TaxID=2719023 RepID=UPI001FF0BB6F|nr:DUF397 domain-containing protein [Saccharopolyspora sp. ASAGF58]